MGQSCLDEIAVPIVADTSVFINLNATGYAVDILSAIPNVVCLTEDVLSELREGERRGHAHSDSIDQIVDHERVEVARLGDEGMACFQSLVDGPTVDTIDDGEAATIACALERSGVALIDDGKARRICADRFPRLITAFTVDLLFHRNVRSVFSRDKLATSIFNALYRGRMRVPTDYAQPIIDVIGLQRAAHAELCRATCAPVVDRDRRPHVHPHGSGEMGAPTIRP